MNIFTDERQLGLYEFDGTERELLLRYFENVLHDIKTPLAVIMATASANGDEPSSRILSNCEKILRLIRDISGEKIASPSGFIPKYVNANIVYTAESVAQSVAPLAAHKELEIIFDTDCEEKLMAIDKDIFERIMLNLLSNAIKFSPRQGRILVSLKAGSTSVTIDIIDEGEGISQDKLASVFNRYETARTRDNPDGAGVGLAIVKELVGMLNGRVSAIRRKGAQGTIMRVWLPIFLVAPDSDGWMLTDNIS